MSETSKTTRVYLIRHGATDSNLKRPYILQGQGINHGINAIGTQQAEAAGNFLSQYKIDHVYSSPMVRAQDTAGHIAKHHDKPIHTVDELMEVNVGDWEGRAWDSIMVEDKEHYEAYMANSGTVPYKNGESYVDVANRALPALEKVCAQHIGETIAVVAHNVINRCVLAKIMEVDMDRAKDIKQNNTGINVLRYSEKGLSLITLNSVFHLENFPES